MAGTVVKMEGAEVAREGPEKTTINITLCQESGLAYLCKGVAGLAGRKAASEDAKDAGQAPRARRPAGGEQKVLGAAQILLGATCIGLGIILSLAPDRKYLDYYHSYSYYYYYYYYYYYRVFYNGVPFWMGTLFILSGTSSVVGARCRGYWVHLAAFLNLASFVAGSVAFTLGLTDVGRLSHKPYFVAELCKHQAEDQGYRSWGSTTSPLYYDDERDRERAGRCQEVFWRFLHMWSATLILLLILHVAALAITLFCFGHSLLRLCCSFWGGGQDYVPEVDPDDSPAPNKLGKE